MHFRCDCGQPEYGILNGRVVGDRLLEDVQFEIRISGNQFRACPTPESAGYFQGLDQKYWLREIEDFAAQTDVFACPNCPEDCWVEDD